MGFLLKEHSAESASLRLGVNTDRPKSIASGATHTADPSLVVRRSCEHL